MTVGEPLALWDGVAPGSESWAHEEIDADQPLWPGARVRNVVVPTLTPHLPQGGSGRAVVVCPGGAFHFLSMDSEGHEVAQLLCERGVAAYVLKYRVVPTPPDDDQFLEAVGTAFREGIEEMAAPIIALAVADADRAIQRVREQGHQHVALIGFSAGGRIGAELVLRGAPERRPDAAALVYVPTVRDAVAPSGAPPLFVLAAADDPLGTDGSLALHQAWREAGLPVELHLFERGGHGFGMQHTGLPVDQWPELFLAWHETLTA